MLALVSGRYNTCLLKRTNLPWEGFSKKRSTANKAMIKSIFVPKFAILHLPLISITSFHIIQHLNHLANIHALSTLALCSFLCRLLSRSFSLFSPLFSAWLPLSGYLSFLLSLYSIRFFTWHDIVPFVSICLSYPPFLDLWNSTFVFLITWWFSFRSPETTTCILTCPYTHSVHSFIFNEQRLLMTSWFLRVKTCQKAQ